jgi:glycosyltransferase involved in cell wall biosynthesis
LRILHLTIEPPYYPAGSGGATRQYFLLKRLIERGHDVHVVAVTTPSRARSADISIGLERIGAKHTLVLRRESRPVEFLESAVRSPASAFALFSRPWFAWRASVFWPRARSVVARELEAFRPDVVTVENDYLADWGQKAKGSMKRVLMTQNVSESYFDTRAATASGLRVLAYRAEKLRYRRFTQRHSSGYDALVACSDVDARRFADRYHSGPIAVVGNGADFKEHTSTPEPAGPPTLIFTGTMFHPPNATGVLWFAKEAWPAIRGRFPDARLMIVGRDPSPDVRALTADHAIEVTGEVPTVAPYFAKSTLAIAPLLSGGGTRLKIVEALASGRAVVATPMAAEGLDLVDGQDILLRASASDFADACCELIADPGYRSRLAIDGRHSALARYDWTSLGDHLTDVLEDVVRST